MALTAIQDVLDSSLASSEANRNHFSGTVTQGYQSGALKNAAMVETAINARGAEIALENPNGNTSGQNFDPNVFLLAKLTESTPAK